MAHRQTPPTSRAPRGAFPLILCTTALCATLAACAAPQPGAITPHRAIDTQAHAPDFARRPFAPFARIDAVAIALREWRAFGSPVDDDPPDTHPDLGEAKPERQPGMWQRIGEYWWLGQDADNPDNGWTGKHDSFGNVFPPSDDGSYAWSAAFISYIMRTDGAGLRFPYSPSHYTYINLAAKMAKGQAQNWVVTAQRPDSYAPQDGDLICAGRAANRKLRFEDLPAGAFEGHCDIVVGRTDASLSVIGGNVDDAVTMKHIPIDADGRIAAPGNVVYDTRYPWMVVLQVLYDQ